MTILSLLVDRGLEVGNGVAVLAVPIPEPPEPELKAEPSAFEFVYDSDIIFCSIWLVVWIKNLSRRQPSNSREMLDL